MLIYIFLHDKWILYYSMQRFGQLETVAVVIVIRLFYLPIDFCHWNDLKETNCFCWNLRKMTNNTITYVFFVLLLYHQRVASDKISIHNTHKNNKLKWIKIVKSSIRIANKQIEREEKHKELTKISYFYCIIIQRSLILWTIHCAKYKTELK